MGHAPVVYLFLLKLAVFSSGEKSKDFFTSAHCPSVSEGFAMTLTFYSENPLDISSQELFFNLRKNAGPDLVSCYQDSTVPAECDVFSDGIETKGVVNDKLTITISNASTAIEGTYLLTVFSSDTKYNPVNCSVRITGEADDKTGHQGTEGDNSAIFAAVVISCVLCFIIAFVILFVWRRWRKRRGYRPHSEKNGNTEPDPALMEGGDDQHELSPAEAEIRSLLSRNENHDEAKAKEFIESTSSDTNSEDIDKLKEKEKELLLDNGPGSFCIRNNPLDPAYDVLSVNHQGAVQIFPIRKEENSIVMEATQLSFKSVSDLVIHYKEHEIRITRNGAKDDVFGKLKIDVTHDLEKQHEKDKQQTGILSSQSADSSVDPKYLPAKDDRGAWDRYSDSKIGSAVDPKCMPATDDRGSWVEISDSKLSAGCENPQTNRPSSSSERKVTTPDPKSPKADQSKEDFTTDANPWYFEDVKTREFERSLLLKNGPGSFLIRPSWNDPHTTLAVNFYGKCEHFTIVREGKKVVLRDTEKSFNSLSDLVEFYKENAIQRAKNKYFGKLIRPCTRVGEKSKGVVDTAEAGKQETEV